MLEEVSDIPAEELLKPAPVAVSVPQARYARIAVAVLFLANGAAVGSWVPHIPERAHALGLNPAQLGSVLLAAGIGALGAMPLAGPLLRRFGSRAVALGAGLLFPLLFSLAILLASVKVLVGVLFLAGLNAAGMDVAMNAHGALVEKLLKRRTISMFHAVFSVGCFAGAGSHSVLMAHGVRDAVLVPASGALLFGMVAGTWAFLIAKNVEDAHHPQDHAAAPKKALRLPDPKLLLLGVLCFSTMVSEGAMGDWSALPNGTAGYGYTAFAATMVLGRFTGDAVVGRLGELRALRLGGATCAAGLLLILLAGPLPLVLLGFALAGAGLANCSPVLYRTAATCPGYAPGEGLSTAVGVGYAGLLVGPPLLGLLGRAAGLASIFWALLGLSLVLAAAAPLVRSVASPPRSTVRD